MSQLSYVETFLRQLSLRLHEGVTYHTLARELVGSLLVEPFCSGAVVDRLCEQTTEFCAFVSSTVDDLSPACRECPAHDPPIPIASVGPFGWLAKAAGERLLSGRCGNCQGTLICVMNEGCHALPFRNPPFVAVRSELLIGGKPWVEWLLVSAACAECGGDGCSNGAIRIPGGCEACGGSKTRTDVKAIAGRYQPDRPWRDEDTARVARFRVRAS